MIFTNTLSSSQQKSKSRGNAWIPKTGVSYYQAKLELPDNGLVTNESVSKNHEHHSKFEF